MTPSSLNDKYTEQMNFNKREQAKTIVANALNKFVLFDDLVTIACAKIDNESIEIPQQTPNACNDLKRAGNDIIIAAGKTKIDRELSLNFCVFNGYLYVIEKNNRRAKAPLAKTKNVSKDIEKLNNKKNNEEIEEIRA